MTGLCNHTFLSVRNAELQLTNDAYSCFFKTTTTTNANWTRWVYGISTCTHWRMRGKASMYEYMLTINLAVVHFITSNIDIYKNMSHQASNLKPQQRNNKCHCMDYSMNDHVLNENILSQIRCPLTLTYIELRKRTDRLLRFTLTSTYCVRMLTSALFVLFSFLIRPLYDLQQMTHDKLNLYLMI